MLITDDYFRNRLDQTIDFRRPLAVLANRMPWQEFEVSLKHRFARQVRTGKKIEDVDMFGSTVVVAGAGAGVSNAGCTRLPTLLINSMLYLSSTLSMRAMKMSFKAGVRHLLGNTFLATNIYDFISSVKSIFNKSRFTHFLIFFFKVR